VKAYVKTARAPGGELKEVPEPTPTEDEVKVRVKAASVCGTDVHIWEWNAWAQSRVHRIPMILGHELSGEVVEVGKRVKGVAVGDHVSAETHIVDGTCYQCRTGRMHICENVQVFGVDRDGIFAEYAVLPELNAWKNDPKLDPALASIQEPLGNAVHCFLPEDNVGDLAGTTVLITGAGPIGLLSIPVAKTLGASKVLITEVNPVRLALAKKMGADRVMNPKEEGPNLAKSIREETEGHGVDVAIEVSGHPSSAKLVFDVLRPGGRVSMLGLFSQEVPINFDDGVVFRAARIHGIFGRRMFDTWFTVKGLLANPAFREKMGMIITHRVPLAELPRAMELIETNQAAKVSLTAKW
jgi:threonine 3-dehydrogenase